MLALKYLNHNANFNPIISNLFDIKLRVIFGEPIHDILFPFIYTYFPQIECYHLYNRILLSL